MIVTDLSMGGLGHVYFNSAFLKILLNTTQEDIHLYVEKKHGEYLKEQIDNKRIIEHPHNLKQRFGLGTLLQDILAAIKLIYIIISSAREQRIIILNRLPLTLLTCNICNIILKRDICNILHGELEYIVNPPISGKTKYYYRLFKLAYQISRFSIGN